MNDLVNQLGSVLQIGVVLGVIVLLELVAYLMLAIMRGLRTSKAAPIKVETPETPKKVEPPPEPAPGPELKMPEAGEDGKVPLECPKCHSKYRVYPNREWYTCSKEGCGARMYLVGSGTAPAAKGKKEKEK